MTRHDLCSRLMKVLYVEDSEADAYLVTRHLRKLGFQIDSKRVWTEEDFLEALQTFAPDIVLSDSNMPIFSGRRALALARAHAPGTRFIYVSGTLRAREDVEFALANGASAYVGKDDLQQLGAAIERALGVQ